MERYFELTSPDTLEVGISLPQATQPENSILVTPENLAIVKPKFDRFPNPTEVVEGVTIDEIQANIIDNEFQRYLQRKEDGIYAYLRISAELRMSKLGGLITDEEHRAIEIALEPVRAEVVLGQWIGAEQKLVELGFQTIGEAMYHNLSNRLTTYIAENY